LGGGQDDAGDQAAGNEGDGDSPGPGSSGERAVADGAGSGGGTGNPSGAAADGVGTRAEGGLSGEGGGFGTMTAAEQVAVLDRRLETSTGDFDALILEEQRKQRERDRARSQRPTEESAESANGIPGRNPYEEGGLEGGNSTGGGMGGIARAGTPPQNPAKYEPPGDIPQGNDDDVVARQLREAAMREPDPEVRERLWNEYRRYKGIDIPEESP